MDPLTVYLVVMAPALLGGLLAWGVLWLGRRRGLG
jgi:hypothetical protein